MSSYLSLPIFFSHEKSNKYKHLLICKRKEKHGIIKQGTKQIFLKDVNGIKKNVKNGCLRNSGAEAGEKAQWLSALTALLGPEFNSQQPQPSVMGSDAFFWCVCRQLQYTHINKINTS